LTINNNNHHNDNFVQEVQSECASNITQKYSEKVWMMSVTDRQTDG